MKARRIWAVREPNHGRVLLATVTFRRGDTWETFLSLSGFSTQTEARREGYHLVRGTIEE
jgi:hypothetical protein